METTPEVARLRDVYQAYTTRGFGDSKWSDANRGNRAIQAERNRRTWDLLQRAGFFPLARQRILDVGCGAGAQLGRLLRWGAKPENLFGVDLIPERIAVAQRRFPEIAFRLQNAEALPYADAAFDLVGVFTVFTSILDPQMAANIGREIDRVLKPRGAVLWYDFRMNNPFNRHVRGMSRAAVRRLFPAYTVALDSVSLFPPLARRLGALTDRLYGPLAALPFLRSHWLGLLTKPGVVGNGPG